MISALQQMARRLTHGLSDQKRSGLFGIGWTSLAQMIGMVIKLGSTLILTRLLAPEAYGILGTAMAVLTTLEWLSDMGIQPALVRHARGGEKPYLLTGWTMGLGRGALLSACAALSAWPLAMFYQEPALLGVLLVLATRPLFMAVRSPALPNLRRKLNYRALFIDEVSQTLVGTICSILMALVFRSVWAIVLGTMAGALTSVVLSYILCPMRPAICWNRDALKDIYSLGHQVFVNTLVMALWLNLDRLLGLKLVSPSEMGLYAIAFNLSAVLENLVTRACDVYFSMLAREQQGDAQTRWHEQVCQRAAGWGMPLAALAILMAPWVIWILYDERYAGAGLLFAIMIARLMVRALGQLQFQYLLAIAQVRIATVAYIVAVAVQAALLVPLVNHFGVAGMAICVLISTTALTTTQTWLLFRQSNRGLRPLISTMSWAATGLLVAILVYGSPTVYIDSPNAPRTAQPSQSTLENRADPNSSPMEHLHHDAHTTPATTG